MVALVRLAGRTTVVTVGFSDHAVERFIERVRPALDVDSARDELMSLAASGQVHVGPPPWRRRADTFLHLALGDLDFPLDADRRGEGLVATTCISRSLPPIGHVGRARRRRRNARERASREYRRDDLRAA